MKPDFLIIPKPVYEKKGLTRLDHEIYAVIYWFSKLKEGKCIASNNVIAKTLEVSPTTLNDSFNRLEEFGFIRRIYKDEAKTERQEIIPLVTFSREEGVTEIRQGGNETAIQSSNIYKNTNNTKVLLGQLPKKYGYTGIKRVITVYDFFWQEKFGFAHKILNWGKTGKMIKLLLDSYSETQIATLISVMFSWYGTDGRNQKEYDFLSKSGFPIEMLVRNHNLYRAYVENVLMLKFDDHDTLGKYVEKEIERVNQSQI